jgi:hypothetical protein
MSDEALQPLLEALDDVRDLQRRFGDLVEDHDAIDAEAFNTLAYNALADAQEQLQGIEANIDQVREVMAE